MHTTEVSPEHLAEDLLFFFAASMRQASGEVFRIADELDLTMTQMKILHVLDGAERELTGSQLASALGLSPAATGRAVDALVRHGAVSRREDETDRRVKRLALTEVGTAVTSRLIAARRESLLKLVLPLEPRERAALHQALQPLLPDSSAGCSDGRTTS